MDNDVAQERFDSFLEQLPAEIASAIARCGRAAELAVVLSRDYFTRLRARGWFCGAQNLTDKAMMYGLPVAVITSRDTIPEAYNGVAFIGLYGLENVNEAPYIKFKLIDTDEGNELYVLNDRCFVSTGYKVRFYGLVPYGIEQERRRAADKMWWSTASSYTATTSATYATDYYYNSYPPKVRKSPTAEDRFSTEDTKALDEFLDSIKVVEQS